MEKWSTYTFIHSYVRSYEYYVRYKSKKIIEALRSHNIRNKLKKKKSMRNKLIMAVYLN